LSSRTEALEIALSSLLEEKQRLARQRLEGRRDSHQMNTESESDVESTVLPFDSGSNIGRYSKQFVKPGPIYNVRRAMTSLEPVEEVPSLRRNFDVVQGFLKTEDMQKREKKAMDKVYTINGLASPFKNSRLNFLIHFHTALSTCGVNPKTEPGEAFEMIATMRPQNPTEELIKQCMIRTFDFEEANVIANPFDLPFIEVGMLISESMLVKCLTLLQSEYRTLWFNSMKCLTVPTFHDEFSTFSTHMMAKSSGREHSRRRTTRRGSDQASTTSESEGKQGSGQYFMRQRKPRTILGLNV